MVDLYGTLEENKNTVSSLPVGKSHPSMLLTAVSLMFLALIGVIVLISVGSQGPQELMDLDNGDNFAELSSSSPSSSSTVTLRIHVPAGESLAPGMLLHGTIGGFKFKGHIEGTEDSPRLKIATGTSELSSKYDPELSQSIASAETQQLSATNNGDGSMTFTADSDQSYPPGTVVSGWVNGKYFRGIVQGPGESEKSRFKRRVGALQRRIESEESRRGMKGTRNSEITAIIGRIKGLEQKMDQAYRQSEKRKPTLISGNIAQFHFHGSLLPAGLNTPALAQQQQQPSSSSSLAIVPNTNLNAQMNEQQQLLQRVENLETEVKSAT